MPLLYFIKFNFFSEILYPASQLSLLSRKEMRVYDALRTDGVDAGRRAVSMIVGRDTSVLSASYTLMLSTRRHFVARICHVMTASAISPAYKFILYAATIKLPILQKLQKLQ